MKETFSIALQIAVLSNMKEKSMSQNYTCQYSEEYFNLLLRVYVVGYAI